MTDFNDSGGKGTVFTAAVACMTLTATCARSSELGH